MSLDGFDTLARLLAQAMLNGLWPGLVLTGLVWLALQLAPRTGAATRFGIWAAALAAVLALLFLPLGGALADPAAPAHAAAPLHLPAGLPVLMLAAWALAAALMLGRLLWSCLYVGWLARTSTPAQMAAPGIRIRTSHETQVPVVIGLWRPAILIPSTLFDQLTAAELDQIVLHECAHIRRRDHWTNAALELLQALFFFHPAVWLIARALRLERELACDDAVVRATGQPVSYAGCLARLVELHSCPASVSPGAAGNARDLFRRVNRLLDWRGAAGFSPLHFAAACAMLLAAMAGAPRLPQWIDVPAPALALAAPRPAIDAGRQALVMEARLRAADILMDAARQRLASADRMLHEARRQMRLAVQVAQGGAPPSVPVSPVVRRQPGPSAAPKLSKI